MEETQETCRVLFLALHGVSMGVGFIITNLICLMHLSVIGVMFHNQKVKKKKGMGFGARPVSKLINFNLEQNN